MRAGRTMVIHERVELTAAQLQVKELNEAGPGIKRASYDPPAGTAWCICGIVFGAAVTKTQADEVLPGLLDALAEVTETMPDRFWMPTPSECLTADTQFNLHCSYTLSGTETFAGEGSQSYNQRGHRTLDAIPVSKLVGVYVLRLPAELDGPGRAALESAVEAIAGVTTCEVLLSGVVPANVTGATLNLEVRYRNDPTPVEEP